jgi:lipopolysaccharide transport system ATP-binding protein
MEPAPLPARTDGPEEDGIAIAVRDVGKMYRMYARPHDRLKQMVTGRFGRTYGAEFWALRHVDFEVRRGERFGVIGRNGSGKSTLLEIIAGTLAPTEGQVEVSGRLSALLELGSGFNPEFTGRENVFISAAIQGLSREQIDARFDEIAAFADIGEFIDQPVKLYSSGMFVRLAFAVGTSIDADLLLIDEALAVGDVFFRQKCYRRLEALRERGVSVVLVSHGMGDVEEFCDRALLLHRGHARFVGPGVEAVKRYYLLADQARLEASPAAHGDMAVAVHAEPTSAAAWPGPSALDALSSTGQVTDGWARCSAVGLTDLAGARCRLFEQGQRAVFWFEFELLRPIGRPASGLVIHSDKGTLVHGKSTLESGTEVARSYPQGALLRIRQEVALEIAAGEYTFEVGLAMVEDAVYERRNQMTHSELASHVLRLCLVPIAGAFAVGFRRSGHPVQLLHHGVANLSGDIHLSAVPPASESAGSRP